VPSFWFSRARDKGLDSLASGHLKSEAMPCDSTATAGGIEETATEKVGLCYNAGTDGYEYDWQVARRGLEGGAIYVRHQSVLVRGRPHQERTSYTWTNKNLCTNTQP
jgi:hypothetical protein